MSRSLRASSVHGDRPLGIAPSSSNSEIRDVGDGFPLQRGHRDWLASLLAALLFVGLTGCANQPVQPKPNVRPDESRTSHAARHPCWWYVRFRLRWPKGEEPPWYPDLVIADQVIGPILKAEGNHIVLWRFHRRAARDGAGRQFSFIFYASPGMARKVNARIAANPWLAQWQRKGIIETVMYDDPGKPQRLGIGDTSDQAWAPEMQRAWPYYIMGVSRLWLELIREYRQAGHLPRSPEARYAAINQKIDRLWRDEGGHALLHHLSAVFGYQEVEVVRRETMRF
jgi:hypothetical protein